MQADVSRILSLEVPIIVQIGERHLSLGEVMSLVPGSLIEIPKDCEDDLELLVNNKVLGSGSAVKVGENFGIKITYLGDLADRVEALGQSEIGDGDDLAELAQALLDGDDGDGADSDVDDAAADADAADTDTETEQAA